MSDPQGQLSDLTLEGSSLNQSLTSSEFADFLPDTSHYFEAWLEDIKPKLEPNTSHPQPRQVTVAEEPTLGEFRFEGTFEGILRVDGYATGFLRAPMATLIVGESADVESDIIVATAIIDGFLCGDIHATKRVELGSHARVFGKIESPALSIAPGAVFEGECHFLPSPFKAGTRNSVGDDDQQTSSGEASLSQSLDFAAGNGETAAAEEPFAAVAAAR